MPAVPKKKHSKARSRGRSSLFAGRLLRRLPSLATCAHCHQPTLPHRVCPHCGYYRGREVIPPKGQDQRPE